MSDINKVCLYCSLDTDMIILKKFITDRYEKAPCWISAEYKGDLDARNMDGLMLIEHITILDEG